MQHDFSRARALSARALLCALLTACGSAAGEYTDSEGDDSDGSVDSAPDGGSPGGGGGPNDTGLPSEDDDDSKLFLRPAQADVHIFIANPDRDTVTRVNVLTQEVRTLRVGRNPKVVRITADYSTAVVYNADDDTISVINATTLDQQVVRVRDNLNAMAMAPGGGHVVLWHDVDAETPEDVVGGAASFQEVSIVDLVTLEHRPMVVGFTPKDMAFTPDGTLALAVADASLAAIHLDDDSSRPEIIPIANPLEPPAAEEVVVDPAGRWAMVRQRATDVLVVVDLEARTAVDVPVGADPTDIDLLPDGSGVVVVSRGAKEVSVFVFADPSTPERIVPFPDVTPLGAVALASSGDAILYTTATATSRYATWNLVTDEITLRPLAKPAISVTRTPTGTSLLVVHDATDNADGSTPLPYRGKPAVTLVDLLDFRGNTISLAAKVLGLANSSDGDRGYLVMEDRPVLAVLDYTTLIFDQVPLRSSPVFVGVLPDLDREDGDEPPAWVSQEHPLGRLSFYDPDLGEVETITGFELNSAIEE